ncbi:hypothetical protein Bhyg_04382, partial [Pseudolycoriella hygida]
MNDNLIRHIATYADFMLFFPAKIRITIRRAGLLAEAAAMFPKGISVTFFTTCVLMHCMTSDCLKLTNEENGKMNLNASSAINFITESVNSSDVRIVACDNFFQNYFNDLSERWRGHVTLTLLNVEKKFVAQRKYPKNEFILMSLKKLSSLLWENKILNFIILRDCKLTVDVHSYFPFANGKVDFHKEQTSYIHKMDPFSQRNLPFFPNKVPLQLNNCKINASTGIWPPTVIDVNSNEPGIEIDLVFLLAKHINASINFVVDSNSWHGLTQDEQGEHTGRLGRLKQEIFDMLVGSIPAHHNTFRDFDASECYLPNSIVFIVPTAAVFPSSLILWSMLEKNTSVFLIIVGFILCLSILTNFLIRLAWKHLNRDGKCNPTKNFFNNTLTTFFVFLRTLIETSTPTLPSDLMTADPVQEKYFTTKSINCTVMMGLKLTAMGEAATFTDILRADHIAAQWVSSSGAKSIYFVTNGKLKYWHNVLFYRGNIFTERMNDLVKRINQSGFWASQIKKYYSRRLIRIMIRQQLMVLNYHRGISNEKLIHQLNKDFRDTSDSHGMEEGNKSEKYMIETNEQEIIQRFVRTDKTLVTEKTYFHKEHTSYIHETDSFSPNSPFFPNKVPLKLNNCQINVSTGVWPPTVIDVNSNEPGIEIDLVFILGKHMNASINFVVDPNSWHGLAQDDEGEHVGRLRQLKQESFDMMAGATPIHRNTFRDFDASESYLPNSIAFIVPTAAVFPSKLILWSMFEFHLNRDVKCNPSTSFFNNTLTTFLVFLRSLIETSTPTLPGDRTIQWIYGMWFLACLIISCYFNTTLASFFTEPGHIKQLKSVEDVIDSKIQIAMSEFYYPIMTADPVQEKHLISRNWNCPVMMGLKLTAMGEAATFTDILRADYIAAQWVSSSGEKSIYFIANGRLKYWHNVLFYRGNVFSERMNDLIIRINQSGFWDSQIRKYYDRRLIRTMILQEMMVFNYHLGISNEKLIHQLNEDLRDTNLSETNEQEIIARFVGTDKTLITWDHLSPVFRLWAIGMAASGITF